MIIIKDAEGNAIEQIAILAGGCPTAFIEGKKVEARAVSAFEVVESGNEMYGPLFIGVDYDIPITMDEDENDTTNFYSINQKGQGTIKDQVSFSQQHLPTLILALCKHLTGEQFMMVTEELNEGFELLDA